MSKKTRVGVLRGGPSIEHSYSLKSGANVLSNLSKDKYTGIDIFIDRDGVWHIGGVPVLPSELSLKIDIIFNALHGYLGEDGKLQNFLDNFSIPYTGQSALTSALSYKKNLTKERFISLGYKTPRYVLLPTYDYTMDGYVENYANKKAQEIHFKLSPPWIVKPLTGGSGLGIRVVKIFEELAPAIISVLESGYSVLIEELIFGKSISSFAVEKLRDEDLYVFPLLEYEDRFMQCPAKLSKQTRENIFGITKNLYNNLGYRQHIDIDFIVTPKNDIYILEINANPKLIKERGIIKMCDSVGISFEELIDHIIGLALNKK